MRRRDLILLLGGLPAVSWATTASAQQSVRDLPRIGAIFNSRSENNEAFREGLGEAGYVDGQNILLEERIIGTALDRADEIARELAALKCKVIFAGTPYAIRAMVKATSTIPIVGVDLESDPVASGLVKSNARPGGNFTGFFLDIPDLGGKQIELLLEALGAVSRLAVVWDVTIGETQFRATESAPRPPGVTLQSLPIQHGEDVAAALERAAREQAQGVILLSSPLIFIQRSQIANLALSVRMPTISLFTSFPKLGGMMAYGPNFPSLYKQSASYVARILAGASPAELPVQRPNIFELVINLKTAKALNIAVPETLLFRADEVIE